MKGVAELHDAADSLNAAIRGFEDAVNSYRPGVYASVPLDQLGDCTRALAWKRKGDVWLVVVEKRWPDSQQDADSPLIKASRETRLTAVPKLAELWGAITAALAVERQRVEQATRKVHDLTDHIFGSFQK